MKMVAEALSKNTKIRHILKDEDLPETHVLVPKDGKSLTIATTMLAETNRGAILCPSRFRRLRYKCWQRT